MTQPVPHGYPDYSRFDAQVDKLYLNQTPTGVVVDQVYGPFFVGDVPAVALLAASVANGAGITLQYYIDSALTIGVGTHQIDLDTTAIIDVVLPNLGPYLTVTAQVAAVPMTVQVRVNACAAQRSALGDSISDVVLFSAIGTAVGAGATVNINATRVRPGPAIINLDTSLATWLAVVNVLDRNGAATRIDTFTHLHAKSPRQYFLPAQKLQLRFTNTTGAGGTVTAAAMVSPAWPGS